MQVVDTVHPATDVVCIVAFAFTISAVGGFSPIFPIVVVEEALVIPLLAHISEVFGLACVHARCLELVPSAMFHITTA
jgi:hypothetical protein